MTLHFAQARRGDRASHIPVASLCSADLERNPPSAQRPTWSVQTAAQSRSDRPWWGAGVRGSSHLRQGIALWSAVAMVGVTIAISAGALNVRAAVGTSAGSVSGTGAILVSGVEQTVDLDLTTDGSTAPSTARFSISDGTNTSPGTATCLFIQGSRAAIGVYLPGPGLYGLLAISDNSPGTDTLWLGTPSTSGPVDCTGFQGSGTTLSSGDFTVSTVAPSPTPPSTAGPSPSPSPSGGPLPSPSPSVGPSPTPPTTDPAWANAGSNVDITPAYAGTINPVTVRFGTVSVGGRTTLTTSATGPALPAGYQLGGGNYFDLATTATYGGTVTVCVAYAGIVSGPTNLLHYEGGTWVDITSQIDPASQRICGTTTSLSPFAVAIATSPVVRRTGTQLSLDGQPFRPIGLDIYNANSNGWCSDAMDGSILDASLTAIGAGKNALRAWFFQPLASTAGGRDWAAFDRTLATAKAHGYKVIATLADQWGDCGTTGAGYGYKDAQWYQSAYRAPDPSATVSYRDWVAEVVFRYRNDPTILAWQLVNEPEVLPAKNGDCSTVPEATAESILAAFAADVSGLIRAIDPNHLISLGTLGGGQCGTQGDDYQTVMSIPTLDLCEYHDYTPGQLVPGDQWNGLQRRINQCDALNKPLLVGELGVRPTEAGGTLAERANVVASKLCAQLSAGVAGVFLWNWDKNGSLLNNFEIGPNDPVLDILAPWSDPGHTCAPPSSPGSVVAAAGDGTASVSWAAPSDGGSPITGYAVTSHPSGPMLTVSGDTTTATISLVDDTTYTFTVTATNAAGTSDPSAASSPVTPRAAASPPMTVAQTLPPARTLTTDPGTGPTVSAPVTVAVTVPAGGSVGIAVGGVTESAPTGFTFLGQQVVVSAPAATADVPLQLTFTLNGSLVGARDPATITVYRSEGAGQPVAVPDCNGTAGTASPDPCVADRSVFGGDLQIIVLTSSASTWNLAVDAAPPVVTIDEVSRPYIGATGSSTVTWHANESGSYSVRLGGADCSTGTALAAASYGTAPAPVFLPVAATAFAIGSNAIRVCVTDAALNTGSAGATIIKDTTTPTVTLIALAGPTPTNAPSVTWTVTFSEPVTGVEAANFTLLRLGLGGSPAITGVTGSGATWTVTASSGTGDWLLRLNLGSRTGIADLAGNSLANTLAGKIYQIDRVAPTIAVARPAAGAVYMLGSAVDASFACADELIGSGIASCTATTANGVRINTASVGPKTYTVVALDRAGNGTTRTVSYGVIYAFSGFLGSVANPPTLNSIKAALYVPLVFSLGGNRGLAILAAGSPSSQPINCTTHSATGVLTPAAGALAYSASTGRYTYTWQTSPAWAGTCEQLTMVLNDGTSHIAYFRLTR